MLGTPTQYRIWDKVGNPTDPEVPEILASLGIKYAVWHHTDTLYPNGNPLDDMRFGNYQVLSLDEEFYGLKLVHKGPDAYIFEITASPSYATKEEVWEKYIE